MREIKFRVWDKEKKKLTDDFYFHEFTDVNCFFSEGRCAFSLDDVVFMEYTGLKDKNGTEIYEGDIIEFLTYDGETAMAQVVFKEFAFKALDTEDEGYEYDFYDLRDIEVIGNIYEY